MEVRRKRAPARDEEAGCVLCGRPLVYFTRTRPLVCAVCHEEKPANAACEAGHFVCDDCHALGGSAVLALMAASAARDPLRLFLEACALPGVHLHGPEHHGIVPCALLTAYKNCGGALELEPALREAWRRGRQLPGGACGYLGVCGAAVGAGVFISVLTGSTPLNGEVWDLPQRMTLAALSRIAEVGGPRCCKRDGRLAIEAAAAFTAARFGVDMPVSRPACAYAARNRECLGPRCPYHAAGGGA